jgi:hypothetical protein
VNRKFYQFEKKEQQTSSYQRLSRESKTIYQAICLDISVNGYRIKWSGEAPKNLRTGEYILVKETLMVIGVAV